MAVSAAVIVSTYNRPENLRRCLEGFRYQTVRDFELLVADDGSGPETAQTIQEAQKDYPVRLHHVWQESRGFRKCRILNEAARQAETDYLIFSDSDCVPHRRFVESHLQHRAFGYFLVGRSVKWGQRRSETLRPEDVARGRHARIGLRDWWDNLRGCNRNLPYGVYLPGRTGFWIVNRLKKSRTGRGGNLSMWKADLIKVNGWNEDFESWGLEDVELTMRLRLAGIAPRLVVNRALTFHLWHPRPDRKPRSARNAYNASKARGLPWCPNGLQRASGDPKPNPSAGRLLRPKAAKAS